MRKMTLIWSILVFANVLSAKVGAQTLSLGCYKGSEFERIVELTKLHPEIMMVSERREQLTFKDGNGVIRTISFYTRTCPTDSEQIEYMKGKKPISPKP